MSRSNLIMGFLLKGAGAIWLLSSSQVGLTNTNQAMSVRIWSSSNCTRLVLESSLTLKYKQFALKNPDRLVIDIKSMNLNPDMRRINVRKCNNNPYIKSTRIAQFDRQTVRIVFELKQNAKIQLLNAAPMVGFKERLVINFYSSDSANPQDSLLILLEDYSSQNYRLNQLPIVQNKKNLVKSRNNRPIIIILDPGHGGEDSGAIGRYHTREKDVVLQIACRLKTLIEREGNMLVYMTRNGDIFTPLKVRVAKAKKQRADLFISIHADSFINRQPSGSSVFTLSNKGVTSIAAKYLADTQNTLDPIGKFNKSGDFCVDHTIFDMMQSVTITDSLKFGKAVLGKLSIVNKLHKNRVEQAGFAVLKAPDIPSILVETAFISNLKEERKLKTAKFQQDVAESILAGIKAYVSDRTAIVRHRRN